MYEQHLICILFYRLEAFSCSEKKRYTPNSGYRNYRIDYSCEHRTLTAAKPGYNIEFEKSDASPVEGADYCKDQSESVNDHQNCLLINSLDVKYASLLFFSKSFVLLM